MNGDKKINNMVNLFGALFAPVIFLFKFVWGLGAKTRRMG